MSSQTTPLGFAPSPSQLVTRYTVGEHMKPAILLISLAPWLAAQTPDARQQLNASLDQLAFSQLKTRAAAIAAIHTRDEAERRKQAVRLRILQLIGGLPARGGPVPVRTFGSLPGDGFRVEKIAYESLPGYFVTANVYVPAAGPGPFPAVVLTPGHEASGKAGQYNWGANLARAGILSIAIDPMGQGERLQFYNPEKKASEVGQGTGEHSTANFSTLLIGDHVSRYFLNDGMRAVDYLTARHDVDAAHIGAFGCSGGGTATAYLAAIDDRIQVAATACYITSFQELLPTRGPQEAEQSIPGFLAEGFDFADWVELAAPKPYAIVSTTEDMFPFAGAKSTYEEARRIYALYGAEDRIQHITGPGGHGNLLPIGGQIVAFLARWLKNDEHSPEFRPSRIATPADLNVTDTGQLSTATNLHSETIDAVNRRRAQSLLAAPAAAKPPADLAKWIRALTHVQSDPLPPIVTVDKTEPREGFLLKSVTFQGDPRISGLLAVPSRPGPKPAVLVLDSAPKESVLPQVEPFVAAGKVVLVLQPCGTPGNATGGPYLGPFNTISLRAMLVGRNLVGLRIDDTTQAVSFLATLPDVDRTRISATATGPMGVVLLHAAVLDSRISTVSIDHTLVSYRMALASPLHRGLAEIEVPGVLLHYDLPDLVRALAPRPVHITNPVNALGEVTP